jgi:molybdopterin/thiamine biosynthesis adenylyltransferase/rhodanese-related sulfurtransferase
VRPLASPAGPLSAAELRRYGRHLVIPEVGTAGQERLKASRVLLVGAGGLGSPLALYLAAAGIGRLGMVDFDTVDESNLQRQVLYGESDVGRPKLEVAAERLREINPHCRVQPHAVRLDSSNALEVMAGYEVVVDGSDNFPTRYLVNDACVLAGKPNVYGSIFRFEGQVAVFWGSEGPCYRCLFPEPPPPGLVPSCAEGGVLGILPGVIGALQANETVKLLLGIGEPMVGRLLLFDALKMQFRELKLQKDPACPLCSESPTQRRLIDYEQFCGVAAAAEEGAGGADLEVEELAELQAQSRELTLLDVRTPQEHAICRLQGSQLIPIQVLAQRWQELDPAAEIVVYCHTGVRSAHATAFLRSHGLEARNLIGGINAWSLRVDPSVPRY